MFYIAINLGVDPKHADQLVKGIIKLPYGTGKSEKIAVFAKDEKAKEGSADKKPATEKKPQEKK